MQTVERPKLRLHPAAGVCPHSRQNNFKRRPSGNAEALRLAAASLVK
jgi:hypothetical protein